jgi:uncharacterized protein YqjF (DUF2071 family)
MIRFYSMRPFLSANWRYLAMLNYVVDPRLIRPLVPPGTEIDYENGQTFLSIVGFLFLDTRLLGFPIPLHRDFEEVNLRFYVRKKSAATWRRGVVFIREIVPRRAIALVARAFYGEPYIALSMRHAIVDDGIRVSAAYGWRRGRKWESLNMNGTGEAQPIPAGSHAEFITEHYWGYTCVRDGCSEYRVEHPRWKIWNATSFEFNADVATLYGEEFVETLATPPRSAFIADGSSITIERRSVLL